MRLHITLDDELVKQIDKEAGPRRRSAFIVEAIREALDDRWRLRELEAGIGSISDTGHEWDEVGVAEWVRQQRRADPRRVG